jgi:hypothetical protein
MQNKEEENEKSFTELLLEKRNDKMVKRVNEVIYDMGAKYYTTYFTDKQLMVELYLNLRRELSLIKNEIQKLKEKENGSE